MGCPMELTHQFPGGSQCVQSTCRCTYKGVPAQECPGPRGNLGVSSRPAGPPSHDPEVVVPTGPAQVVKASGGAGVKGRKFCSVPRADCFPCSVKGEAEMLLQPPSCNRGKGRWGPAVSGISLMDPQPLTARTRPPSLHLPHTPVSSRPWEALDIGPDVTLYKVKLEQNNLVPDAWSQVEVGTGWCFPWLWDPQQRVYLDSMRKRLF